MNTEFKKHLEEIETEISLLQEEEIFDWIEEHILEVQNKNELVLTYGGPSIRLYIDSGVLIGQSGFSSDRVFIDCNTRKFEEFFELFDI